MSASASRMALAVDSAAFVLGFVLALAGTWFTLLALLFFDLLRGIVHRPESVNFPHLIDLFTSLNVPAALLFLAVGWFVARRGTRRLVSPSKRARIQAVLVRGLGALLLLPALLVAAAWVRDRSHLGNWPYRFVVYGGLASVSCLLGAYAQLLRPPRIGPFLFGAAVVLGATAVFEYARAGWDRTSFDLGVACAITLLLTAPWQRLAARVRWRREVVAAG